MGVAARHRSFVLALWLCLATVLAHSVLPVGSPLAPRHGSAFSASTTDVALSPSRRQDQGKSDQFRVARDGGELSSSGSGASPALLAAFAQPRLALRTSEQFRFAVSATPLDRVYVPGARPRAPPLA